MYNGFISVYLWHYQLKIKQNLVCHIMYNIQTVLHFLQVKVKWNFVDILMFKQSSLFFLIWNEETGANQYLLCSFTSTLYTIIAIKHYHNFSQFVLNKYFILCPEAINHLVSYSCPNNTTKNVYWPLWWKLQAMILWDSNICFPFSRALTSPLASLSSAIRYRKYPSICCSVIFGSMILWSDLSCWNPDVDLMVPITQQEYHGNQHFCHMLSVWKFGK